MWKNIYFAIGRHGLRRRARLRAEDAGALSSKGTKSAADHEAYKTILATLVLLPL